MGHKITITYSYTDMLELLPSMLEVFASYPSIEKQRKQAIFNACIYYFPLILNYSLCYTFYSKFDAKSYPVTLKCPGTYPC